MGQRVKKDYQLMEEYTLRARKESLVLEVLKGREDSLGNLDSRGHRGTRATLE